MPDPRNKPPMTEQEMAAFLQRKILSALNEADGDVSDIRQDSLDYYVGKEYGNERDGFSQVVSRETMEVVEWAKPSIMRALIREKVVEFDPVGMEDVEQADQETDAVNHVLMKENQGFLEIYQWVSDLLMYPNGYIKAWVEDEENLQDEEEYEGLTMEQVGQIQADSSYRIIEQSQYNDEVLVNGQVQQIPMADLTVQRIESKRCYRVRACPPEDVLVDSGLSSIDLDRADFICHRYKSNWTELVEQGLDPDKLASVGTDDSHRWQDETVNRKFHEDEDPDGELEQDDSMREYWVHECWAKFDADGDGLAEQHRTLMIGQTIFEDEIVPYQPFVAASAIVMAHKHTGMSYFEVMRDLQLIRSVIKRQILDNAYRINLPKRYVGEAAVTDDGSTMDALLDNESEFIPCLDPSAIITEQGTNIIGDLLQVDQSLKDDIQMRTGVAPNLSLDPAVLQQSTMGAYMGAMEQATQRIELIVRLIAEVGLKPLVRKVHTLLRLYQDVPKMVKLRSTWVEVNPMEWRDRTNLSVNVGLGFRNPSEKIQLLEQVLQKQQLAMQFGMATPTNIYNTLEQQVDLAGLGDAALYFQKPDPNAPPPGQEQQPDPQVELIQAQLQLAQQAEQRQAQKDQAEMQLKQAELQLKAQEMQQKQQMELQKLAASVDEIRARIEKLDVEALKVLQEARQLDLENDAAESGVNDLLTEFENAATQFSSAAG